jgi:hypothetical protein
MQQGTSHRDPVSTTFRRKSIMLIILVLLVGFLYSVLRLF